MWSSTSFSSVESLFFRLLSVYSGRASLRSLLMPVVCCRRLLNQAQAQARARSVPPREGAVLEAQLLAAGRWPRMRTGQLMMMRTVLMMMTRTTAMTTIAAAAGQIRIVMAAMEPLAWTTMTTMTTMTMMTMTQHGVPQVDQNQAQAQVLAQVLVLSQARGAERLPPRLPLARLQTPPCRCHHHRRPAQLALAPAIELEDQLDRAVTVAVAELLSLPLLAPRPRLRMQQLHLGASALPLLQHHWQLCLCLRVVAGRSTTRTTTSTPAAMTTAMVCNVT